METSQSYFEARFLIVQLSRFSRVDSFAISAKANLLTSPQFLNPYPYCGNNPLIHIDPTGLEMQFSIGVGALLGGSMIPILSPFGSVGGNIGFTIPDMKLSSLIGERPLLGNIPIPDLSRLGDTHLFWQHQETVMAGPGFFGGLGAQLHGTVAPRVRL